MDAPEEQIKILVKEKKNIQVNNLIHTKRFFFTATQIWFPFSHITTDLSSDFKKKKFYPQIFTLGLLT